MESKLKQQCQDSVGELPAGYLHLPTTPIKNESNDSFGASSVITEEYKADQQRKNQQIRDSLEAMPKSDAWNDAGTKPDHPCICETELDSFTEWEGSFFQYWNGEFWCFASGSKDQAIEQKDHPETSFNVIQWRDVQP